MYHAEWSYKPLGHYLIPNDFTLEQAVPDANCIKHMGKTAEYRQDQQAGYQKHCLLVPRANRLAAACPLSWRTSPKLHHEPHSGFCPASLGSSAEAFTGATQDCWSNRIIETCLGSSAEAYTGAIQDCWSYRIIETCLGSSAEAFTGATQDCWSNRIIETCLHHEDDCACAVLHPSMLQQAIILTADVVEARQLGRMGSCTMLHFRPSRHCTLLPSCWSLMPLLACS